MEASLLPFDPYFAQKGAWCQDRAMKTRAELTTLIDALEAAMPALVRDNPDPADFWPAFAGHADVIEDSAETGADALYVQERIDQLLAKHGHSMLRIDTDQP